MFANSHSHEPQGRGQASKQHVNEFQALMIIICFLTCCEVRRSTSGSRDFYPANGWERVRTVLTCVVHFRQVNTGFRAPENKTKQQKKT